MHYYACLVAVFKLPWLARQPVHVREPRLWVSDFNFVYWASHAQAIIREKDTWIDSGTGITPPKAT